MVSPNQQSISLTPVPGSTLPSSGFCGYCKHTVRRHICRQNTHTKLIDRLIFKKCPSLKFYKQLLERQDTIKHTDPVLVLPCFVFFYIILKTGVTNVIVNRRFFHIYSTKPRILLSLRPRHYLPSRLAESAGAKHLLLQDSPLKTRHRLQGLK